MAGHVSVDESLEEDYPLLKAIFSDLEENLILSNHNFAQSSSSSHSDPSSATRSQDALITNPPALPLELRQNNPQDCSNLITASVNSATVEISRTIIALNATFSQQLQQASISASNGIKAAQGSASSTIAIVVSNASVATSSAFSSVTVANLAVTSANLALTNAQSTISSVNLALTSVSSASSTDVARLSSSLTLLQASVASIQSSASAAIAAAQSALASATGSAASQASSILASAAATSSIATNLPSTQPLPVLQAPTISLTPAQAAGIVVGSVVTSILLSFAIYFLIIRRKKKERDSYLDEKSIANSPRKLPLPSRSSSTFRTGNSMVLKLNPPRSPDISTPGRSALKRPEDFPVISSYPSKGEASQTIVTEVDNSSDGLPSLESTTGPLTLSFTKDMDISSNKPQSSGSTTWPLNFSTASEFDSAPTAPTAPIAPPAPKPRRKPPKERRFNSVKTKATIVPHSSSEPTEAFLNLNLNPNPNLTKGIRTSTTSSLPPLGPTLGKAASKKLVTDYFQFPFAKTYEEPVIEQMVEKRRTQELTQAPIDLTDNVFATKEPDYDEPIKNPFEEPAWELVEEETEDPWEQPKDEGIEMPFENPFETPFDQQLNELTFEYHPEEIARVPTPEPLALFQEDEQPRYSALSEIETVGKIMQQNKLGSPDPEVERAISSPLRVPSPVEEFSLSREVSPPRQDTEDPVIIQQRDRTLSPLRRNPIVDIAVSEIETETVSPEPYSNPHEPPPPLLPVTVEKREESSPPRSASISIERKEISPLRRNPTPQFRNIDFLLAEHEADQANYDFFEKPSQDDVDVELEAEEDEVDEEDDEDEADDRVDDREERGRSMIRTSDIIDARLSTITARIKEEGEERIMTIIGEEVAIGREKEEKERERMDRTKSPLTRNPVDPSPGPRSALTTDMEVDPRDRTLSPLRRNPVDSSTSSHIPDPLPTTTTTPLSRDDSPLRRNPIPLSSTTPPPPLPTMSLLRPIPTTTATLLSRDDSPLRRNPLTQPISSTPSDSDSKPKPSSDTAPKLASNPLFSQALSKFQTLASQAPDSATASHEMTQRAIAGICIPGSLREQAVRNLSKSRDRERGKSRSR